MKILLLGAAAAAMTLTGFAASAQSYGGHRGGYDQHSSWNHSDNRRGYDQQRGYDQRRGYDNRYSYNQRSDRSYGYDRGYGYDRDDNGAGLSSALAGGLLGFVLGGALSNNNNTTSYGYAQPTYQQPYGYGGYGYQQPYGYSPYGYR